MTKRNHQRKTREIYLSPCETRRRLRTYEEAEGKTRPRFFLRHHYKIKWKGGAVSLWGYKPASLLIKLSNLLFDAGAGGVSHTELEELFFVKSDQRARAGVHKLVHQLKQILDAKNAPFTIGRDGEYWFYERRTESLEA